MLNKLLLLIVKGLLTVLPFVLTVYLLVWAATSIESALVPYLPYHSYFPGQGILLVLVLLAIIGVLVNAYVVKWLINKSHALLARVPLVKTLFGAIQDAVELFHVKKDQNNKKAVSVELTDGVQVIGFITNEQIANRLYPNANKVAVYLPLSYQLGGYTVYVDSNKVSDLDVDVETAMRIAVTGGSSIAHK